MQGTAGLRLLTDKQIEAILEDVREELFDSPFIFEPTWAKVISGHQEGMNGWLATNYLLGSFDDKQQSSGHVDTIGVLEVGGASMQATFHSDKYTGDVNPDDADVVSLNGVDYTIYTHSYLDYGLDKAQEVVSMRNFKQIEESGNPCYNPGLRHSATGDFNACVELVKTMFPVDEACKWGSDGCSFNGISQPRIYDEPFYAIENFYYTTHFFGIEDSEHPMEDLRVKGKEFCSLSIEDAKAQHPNEPEYDLSKYCFSSAYLTTLVEYGLHFPSDEHVRIMKTINDNDIDWALGAVLYSLTQDPAEMALYRKEFVFLGCVGALLCLGAILFFYNKYHKGGIAYSSLAKSNRISFNV